MLNKNRIINELTNKEFIVRNAIFISTNPQKV